MRYAEERRWDVFPGTWLDTTGGVPRCSCGDTGCASPGAHPAGPGWAGEATGSVTAVRRLWSKEPRAAVLLPTGRTFDAIDVPETAGCLALARMERLVTPPGPVIGSPDGRMLFLVQPGAAAKVPELVRRLGWSPGTLNLLVRGEGEWVAAPPTRLGTRGAVQWACGPSSVNRWLPDAEALAPALSYACGHAATHRRGQA
ncbi:DNA primase [Streptomyces armeniacus]|uniref:DNA primase n=1 Tax=Streptomyces armeniacus TaxID=83291 RepID=A0A345XKU8_9ACTN|nr:DNA primase [Streptomyces armeniacus]